MAAIVLDTGALIAIDRGDRRVGALLRGAAEDHVDVITSSACIAEAWRNPAHQARLARALSGVIEHPLDPSAARASGRLLARAGLSDIADAAVARLAGPGDTVVTSDPAEITTLLAAAGTTARILRV